MKAEIDAIGKRVGGLLWDVDEKLVALLDDDDQALREAGREEAD